MTAKWEELTREEQQTLERLYSGHSQMLTVEMANRLKEKGLAEEKLGGTGINKAGKELIARRIIATRR